MAASGTAAMYATCAVVTVLGLTCCAAAAPQKSLVPVSGVPAGVTAFTVPNPGNAYQLSGGAVMGSDNVVFYGATSLVYRVQFSADHTTATLTDTIPVPGANSYYQGLGGPVPSLTLVNDTAWFKTRTGGIAGGLAGFSTQPGTIGEVEFDTIPNTRMQYAFMDEGNVGYIVMDKSLYVRSAPSNLTHVMKLPEVFSPAYRTSVWENSFSMFWQYEDGYLYMLGLSAKPGHSSSEPPWFTVTRVNIHRAGLNQTMYLRQWSDASPALPATIAFDDEYMYVTYVPVYNSVSSADDPDYQEVAQSIEVLRYPRATAFQATNTAVTVLSFECIAFYPQASNPMVDRTNGYLYLICGGDITRVSLTPATLGQASAMCSGPIPDGKMAQYYWPRTVPQSQVLPLSFTTYGEADIGSVTNAVGWLDLKQVAWTSGVCPYDLPWYAEWWVWALIAVGVASLCIAWWRVRRCLRASWAAQQQRAGATAVPAGASYQKMGGADDGGAAGIAVGYGYGSTNLPVAEAAVPAAPVPVTGGTRVTAQPYMAVDPTAPPPSDVYQHGAPPAGAAKYV